MQARSVSTVSYACRSDPSLAPAYRGHCSCRPPLAAVQAETFLGGICLHTATVSATVECLNSSKQCIDIHPDSFISCLFFVTRVSCIIIACTLSVVLPPRSWCNADETARAPSNAACPTQQTSWATLQRRPSSPRATLSAARRMRAFVMATRKP